MENAEKDEHKMMGVGLKASDAIVACLVIAKIMGKDATESKDALEAAAAIGAQLKYDDIDCMKALVKARKIYESGPEGFMEWILMVAVERLDDADVEAKIKETEGKTFVMTEAGHA
jgi:hypothetical protein